MNDIVKEWLDKAERDFATARRELAVVEQPNYDAVDIATRLREKLLFLIKRH